MGKDSLIDLLESKGHKIVQHLIGHYAQVQKDFSLLPLAAGTPLSFLDLDHLEVFFCRRRNRAAPRTWQGTSSQRVPAAMPDAGSPFSSS